jgi:hypothetical protein
MVNRVRLEPKTNSKSTSVTSAPTRRWTLFGQPQLLEGEEAAAYHELCARIRVAVKPVDIIDEIFIDDVVGMGGLAMAPVEIEPDPSART